MSRFLNPQWLQRWHLSKVQQKPHSLIISLAVRTRRETENWESKPERLKFKLLSFPERIKFNCKFFFILLHFLFSWCVGQNPAGGPRTSDSAVASALLLPPLLNHGSNTLQMNKHLHPFSVKARRLLRSRVQEREKESEKEMESWRRSTGIGWQMEGWINVEMNQQQSNKAAARFSGSSRNLSDLFPPWHNYHSPPNYFFLLNRFLMADCGFFMIVFAKKEVLRAVVQPCRLRLCPQTAQEGGRGRRGRRWVGCLWRMGQAPDQHFPGPVTVPEYSRHVCTVWERKWQTDLGVCFVSPFYCFLLVSRHLTIIS